MRKGGNNKCPATLKDSKGESAADSLHQLSNRRLKRIMQIKSQHSELTSNINQ